MTGEEGYTVRGQNRYTVDRWSRKHSGKVAFVLGLFVGAGTALLFASTSGRETREKILETSKALTDQAGGCYSTAKDTVTEAVEKGTGWIRSVGPALVAAIQSAREAYVAEKSRVAHEIGEGSS